MTITINLAPETEAQLRSLAAARGEDPDHYAAATLARAIAEEAAGVTDRLETKQKPKTGAELLQEWQREGLLTGYGDPAIDSPELARQLRQQAQTRQWDPPLFLISAPPDKETEAPA